MGFFENLGRKVGEFTQEAKESAAEEAAYGCRDCGELFYTEQSTCQECGSEDVVELDRGADEQDTESDQQSPEPDDRSDTS